MGQDVLPQFSSALPKEISSTIYSNTNHCSSNLLPMGESMSSLPAVAVVPNQDNNFDDLSFLDDLTESSEWLQNTNLDLNTHSLNMEKTCGFVTDGDIYGASASSDMLEIPDLFQLIGADVYDDCKENAFIQRHSEYVSSTVGQDNSLQINEDKDNCALPGFEVHGIDSPGAEETSISSTEKSDASYGHKYLEMRRKNNIASRRSRQNRKAKEFAMGIEANDLEKENKKLKCIVQQLEKQRDILHAQITKIVWKKAF